MTFLNVAIDDSCWCCVCRERVPRLKASEFIAGNVEHMQSLSRMGIHLVTMTDGRVQLLHISSQVSCSTVQCVLFNTNDHRPMSLWTHWSTLRRHCLSMTTASVFPS